MDVTMMYVWSGDTISDLPDELLISILSLLPTKLAASTSLLSKRWRNVYKSVDTLDFDDSVLLRPRKRSRYANNLNVFPESFKKFVDQALALQCDYPPIKKFSLKCQVGCDESEEVACVRGWICNVVEHGVSEADLRCTMTRDCNFLPSQLFISKTLVKLTLGTQLCLQELPSYVFLPALKTLWIDSVWFGVGEFYDILLPGCPVLEELSLRYKLLTGHRKIITSPKIKRLSVHRYTSVYDGDFSTNMGFDTPSVIYLDYSDYALSGPLECNFSSLVEARLDLKKFSTPNVTDFIMRISNVRVLHLSPDSVDVISYRCNEIPMFDNLVKLSFGSHNKQGWKLLAYLLKQSPMLETLIIEGLCDYSCDVSLPENQVKVLQILSYGGTDRELKQLKNFMEKLEFLELLKVEVKDYGSILQTKRDLMMLPRVYSASCKIQVL